MTKKTKCDVAVVGGGLVGCAAALGMARAGAEVIVMDAGDHSAFRASRGNFGLVWAQSKGTHCRAYAVWTRHAVADWPALQEEIRSLTGIDVGLQGGPGLHLCLSPGEYEKRAAMVAAIRAYDLPGDDTRMIDAQEAREYLPGLGPSVIGASVSSLDGACQSLALYRGLIAAAQTAGARLRTSAPITWIEPRSDGFALHSREMILLADKVLITTGLLTRSPEGTHLDADPGSRLNAA